MAARKKKKRSKKKKTSKKRGRKRAARRRGGKMPLEVIRMHAKSLKKNKRAAAVYRDVLGT